MLNNHTMMGLCTIGVPRSLLKCVCWQTLFLVLLFHVPVNVAFLLEPSVSKPASSESFASPFASVAADFVSEASPRLIQEAHLIPRAHKAPLYWDQPESVLLPPTKLDQTGSTNTHTHTRASNTRIHASKQANSIALWPPRQSPVMWLWE